MNIVFRVDATVSIGTGHLMRCLALAEELRSFGFNSHFVCADLSQAFSHEIEKRGFSYSNISKTSKLEDVTLTLAAVASKANAVIIDHYDLDIEWEKAFREACTCCIVVLDDLANRSHDADILIDQNLFKNINRYKNLVPSHTQCLIGPSYALLRPEFVKFRTKSLLRREGLQSLRKICIFFGGTDPTNETLKVIEGFRNQPSHKNFEFLIITGIGNPWNDQIAVFCQKNEHFRHLCQVQNFAELITSSDAFIGAGGSTNWERCSLGIPSIVSSLAENQIEPTQLLDEKGAVEYIGDAAQLTPFQYWERLVGLDIERARILTRISSEIVDGKGLARVANAIKHRI